MEGCAPDVCCRRPSRSLTRRDNFWRPTHPPANLSCMRYNTFPAASAILLTLTLACGTPETATVGGPMEDGAYTATNTRNAQYTTCSSCQASFTTGMDFAYVAASKSYDVTVNNSPPPVNIALSSGNKLVFPVDNAPFTHTNGCPGEMTPRLGLTLNGRSFVGALQVAYNVQACGGYAALSCTCAYDVAGSQ